MRRSVSWKKNRCNGVFVSTPGVRFIVLRVLQAEGIRTINRIKSRLSPLLSDSRFQIQYQTCRTGHTGHAAP
jgi:hypothetical protein